MTLLQIIVLAVIQGLTEFLPISSSAHLILPAALFGWPDQGLAFDVAVHVGTLAAVLWYFRTDLRDMIGAWTLHCVKGEATPESRLAWLIVLATIPAGLAGLLFDNLIETHLRSVLVIALATIVFGLALGWSDRVSSKKLTMTSLGWRQALIIGLAQALALIPGTSRSGITMTAALALGFDRTTAAKFSFLLSIPIILLSGGYKSVELLTMSQVPWLQIGAATVLSGLTAYACIHVFLAWVDRVGMMPFVWYRLVLGLILLVLILMGMV